MAAEAQGDADVAAVADVALSDQQRRQVDAIASLLTQPDQAAIRQGIELATALDDQLVFAALTDGVEPPTEVDEKQLRKTRYPTLGRGVIFDGVEANQAWLDLAMAHLVAASGLPVRTEVRSIAIGARKGRPPSSMPSIWIEGLERLTSLTHLDLLLSPLERGLDLQVLERFPNLTHLRLRGSVSPGPIPALERLEVLDGVAQINFAPGAVFPALRSVRGRFDQATFTSSLMPKLVDVNAKGHLRLEGFESLRQLRCNVAHIELPGCERVDYLSVFNSSLDAPELRHVGTLVGIEPGVDVSHLQTIGGLRLNRVSKFEGGTFPEGTRLLHHKVVLWGPVLADLGNIGELPGLEMLTLLLVKAPISLETLRNASDLRVLDIRNSPGITDFSPLVGLPNLEAIVVGRSDTRQFPDELVDKVRTNWRPTGQRVGAGGGATGKA